MARPKGTKNIEAKPDKKGKDGMTPKQKKFCEEYLIDLNATQAAIRAGYSQETAFSIGSENLRKPLLRTHIEKLIDERSKRTLVHADFVIENLVEVSQRCLQKVPVMVFDPVEKKMVQKQDEEKRNVWAFDSIGANRSLELLGKHMKMFTDKVEEGGSKEVTIKVVHAKRDNNNP